jgi:hypothetical protein
MALPSAPSPTRIPEPSFSVWQEFMHRWLELPNRVEQFDRGRIGAPLGVASRGTAECNGKSASASGSV